MRTRRLLAPMTILLLVAVGRLPAQEISVTLTTPDQTGYVGGPLIAFDATIQNLTATTISVVSSNLNSNNVGKANFDPLNDISDNFSPFSLAPNASLSITDLFDFTVNPTSINSTPSRPLNPSLDYSFGQYQIFTSDSTSASDNFIVRLQEVPTATPEPSALWLFVSSGISALSLLGQRRRKR